MTITHTHTKRTREFSLEVDAKDEYVGFAWGGEEAGAEGRSRRDRVGRGDCDCRWDCCGGGCDDWYDREAAENQNPTRDQKDPNSDRIATSDCRIVPKRSSYNSN